MATETSSDPDLRPAPPPGRIALLTAKPEAARWARECAWVPGTGYCRRRPCSPECAFNDQRVAEAARLVSWRRQRRPSQRPGAERPAPARAALVLLRRLLREVFA